MANARSMKTVSNVFKLPNTMSMTTKLIANLHGRNKLDPTYHATKLLHKLPDKPNMNLPEIFPQSVRDMVKTSLAVPRNINLSADQNTCQNTYR